jgi:hypothetical protein
MTDTVFVKPREGARIRQPERRGRILPAQGGLVPRDAYYDRLITSGDVIPAEATKKPKAAADGEGTNSDKAGVQPRRRPAPVQAKSEG